MQIALFTSLQHGLDHLRHWPTLDYTCSLLECLGRSRGVSVTVFAKTGSLSNCSTVTTGRPNGQERSIAADDEKRRAYGVIMNRLRKGKVDAAIFLKSDRWLMEHVRDLGIPCWVLANAATVEQSVSRLYFTAIQRPMALPRGVAIPIGVELLKWPFSSRPVPNLLVSTAPIGPEAKLAEAIALAKSLDLQLMIAGPIVDEDYYRQEVLPLLDTQRKYLGHLSSLERSRLYTNALCCLSLGETEPSRHLTILEAMACGTPVVSSDPGMPKELTELSGLVVVEKENQSELTKAVQQALERSRAHVRQEATGAYPLGQSAQFLLQALQQEKGMPVFEKEHTRMRPSTF